MKVGLLQCDHVADHLLDFGGDYDQMFRDLLPELDLVVYQVCNDHFPANVNLCDAYIVTGSKYSVYDDIQWIHKLKAFVKEIYDQKIKFIGVCFGHQMLAEALGGQVEKSNVGWCVGVHSFEILSPTSWMTPFQNRFSLIMSCQDQVIKLPNESTILAESTNCRIGIFQVGKTMLGIQGHPEFPQAYSRALMESRVDQIGKEKTRAGIESLSDTPDSLLLAEWMYAFLKMQ